MTVPPSAPAQPGRRRRKATWPQRILLLLAPFALTAAGAEIGLRIVDRFPPEPRFFVGERENRPSDNFVPDPETGWRMPPDHLVEERDRDGELLLSYRSNAQGFRSDVDFGPRTDRRRVVVVGDSNTYGIGVPFDKTYPQRLQAKLPRTEVFNLAMPGFGVDQMWQAVRHQALPLRPDLVIVGIFPADFRRALTAYRASEGFNKPSFKLVDGRLEPCTADDRPGAVHRFLENHSYAWSVVRLAHRWFGLHRRMGYFWRLNEAFLEAIRTECEAAGVKVLFVYLPYRTWRSCEALHEWATETGAELVDLAEADHNFATNLHRGDGHLSGPGNGFAARVLTPVVRRLLEN